MGPELSTFSYSFVVFKSFILFCINTYSIIILFRSNLFLLEYFEKKNYHLGETTKPGLINDKNDMIYSQALLTFYPTKSQYYLCTIWIFK